MWTCLIALVLVTNPTEAVSVSARLSADKLEVGPEYAFTVTVAVADGYTTTRTSGPSPILQIDVPPSVELSGAVLKTPAERSHHGFLYQPFARVIGPGVSTIRFKLKSAPAEGESFKLNVLGYVAARDSADVGFFRHRLALPLKPNAESGPANAVPSTWGDEPILNLGDKATPFTLKRYYQPDISLSDYAGKSVIITTYRSFLSVPCQHHLAALHDLYAEFEQRGVTVIAIAQEDLDIESHANIRKGLPEKPRFILTADPPRSAQTAAYERLTTYLIDKDGVVRQIMPGTIEQRAPWRAVLAELDRLQMASPTGR